MIVLATGSHVVPNWKIEYITYYRAPDKVGIEDNSKIIFVISQQNLYCDPTLELSR